MDFEASCFFFNQTAEDKESTEAILISSFDPKEMNVCFKRLDVKLCLTTKSRFNGDSNERLELGNP